MTTLTLTKLSIVVPISVCHPVPSITLYPEPTLGSLGCTIEYPGAFFNKYSPKSPDKHPDS